MKNKITAIIAAALAAATLPSSAQAEDSFTIGWSNYIGWCPVKSVFDSSKIPGEILGKKVNVKLRFDLSASK